MKSIAVITDSKVKYTHPSHVGKTLRSNLVEVFGDEISVSNYFIDQLSPRDIITEDLILIMGGSRAIKVKQHVENTENVILAKRTFLKSGLEQIYAIPDGTDVLVVNDNIETVLDCVATLYDIGINHLNLIPFESGKSYAHIDYAVSPSEMDLIPEGIRNIYDLKERVIDIPTMLTIMGRLKIDSKAIQQRLYNYYQKIFSVNESVKSNYNALLQRSEELDCLLDLSHDGIVLTDVDGCILIYNKTFRNIFNIQKDVTGLYLHDVVKNINIRSYYNDSYHDDLITYQKKSINLEKRSIVHFNEERRMYFSFQEVTYIKKLEQNLSRKLRQKGQTAKYYFDDILTQSTSIETIIKSCQKIAQTDLTVFITGESGTGKEVFAQAIHNASDRKHQPFIAINSSAIPDSLLESELFGYASGSFTGALKHGKKGIFELANNGTIFLDEIGDMPIHLQSKLLRVLQEMQITPVGSEQIIDIDVRVIAATHKNPLDLMERGVFRKDLFYRLNVFPIELPPLRARKSDILLLLEHFTSGAFTLSEESRYHLMSYDWPGNIRELSNVANYIAVVGSQELITPSDLPQYILELTSSKNSHPSYKADFNDALTLSEKFDLNIVYGVLSVIHFLNDINKTAGRKHILELLYKKEHSLKESTLRRLLTQLKDRELIIIKKGRSGCYITPKGETFLEKGL